MSSNKYEGLSIQELRKLAEGSSSRRPDAIAQRYLGLRHLNGQGVPKDENESVRWFRLAADQGDAPAQGNLGYAYHVGRGVSKDEREAARWYRLAADQGDAAAQGNLGGLYAGGNGVPKDEREAVRWFRLSADQGHAWAQFNLGAMFDAGRGVPKDEREAIRWYRLAADQGNPDAQVMLAGLFLKMRGEFENEREAVRWLRRVADRSEAWAQVALATMYWDGRVVPRDAQEAARWMRLAADQGHADAQSLVGAMYAEGEGLPKDEREAVRWFRLAAGQGVAFAQSCLGDMYVKGRGVLKDEREAVRWYRAAADQGYAEAQGMLGVMYAEGEGVPQNEREAVRWLRLAADQGYASAQAALGMLYEEGRGVPKDEREAAHWYSLASKQGLVKAAERLTNLRRRSASSATSADSVSPLPTRLNQSADGQSELRNSEDDDNSVAKFLEDAFAEFVGLETVRNEILRQASYIQVQKLRAEKGLRTPVSPSRHLVFTGNPGTGKTTIARIIAGLYRRLGVLKTDKVIETDRAGLVAPYVGQTALKTRDIVESALGGVLFIDEAYTLAKGSGEDFGREAIETLLKLMEDHREELVVIVAGYEAEMDSFIKLNPGLQSRFNRYIRFPDYTPDELLAIFGGFCNANSYVASESIHSGLRVIFGREIQAQRQRFSNARYVRNLFEKVIEAQAHRLFTAGSTSQSDLQALMPGDVESALGEALPADGSSAGNFETALKRLNALTGLKGVKKQVQRLFDFIRVQRSRAKGGTRVADGFSQHLVFTGNPGTGKTTVARIIADLYFALEIIPSNRIVEVDRSGLVAGYIGQSAIKTQQVVESALGGVLFIDEAYTLAKGGEEKDFGQEVIDTLLKAMEDHRNELVVIVAGYNDLMRKFIDSNPGLRSRFNRYIEFEDYGPHDLVAIFESLCNGAEYALDGPSRSFLLENFERLVRAKQTTGNGRFVRNLFERCIEVQSQRVARKLEISPDNLNVITQLDLAGALKETTTAT